MAIATPRVILDRVPAIERLRERATVNGDRIDLSTVRAVVDGLSNATSLGTTAQALGAPEKDILDIVAELGTWLTHVHGGGDVKITYAADQLGQLSLFGAKSDGVVVPLGYERRGGHRRDLSKSIAAIVRLAPDDAELGRWLDRKYPNNVGILSGGDVYLVWCLARLNRLDEVDLVSTSQAFAQVMVAAFDLLDVALADAISGMVQMVRVASAGEVDFDVDTLRSATTKVAWLNEGRIRKITNLLSMVEGGESSARQSVLRELRSFSQEVRSNPDWRPTKVAQLSQGQIMRLVERSGLGIPEDAKQTESEIRRKLVALGLRKDVDRLLPDAMRAVRAKVLDTFWTAIAARQAGEPDWRAELEEALLEHASA